MKGFLVGVFAVFFMSPFNISGNSMEPTFSNGDTIMFEGLTYAVEAPMRGDVVVFYGTDEPDKIFVKRIIGLPGEEVVIRERRVYINGELLEEPYLGQLSDPANLKMREYDGITYEVPEGKYFMLGDNRQNSFDSRTWNDPFVPLDNIIAKYYFDIY